jgi:hypothetical protein
VIKIDSQRGVSFNYNGQFLATFWLKAKMLPANQPTRGFFTFLHGSMRFAVAIFCCCFVALAGTTDPRSTITFSETYRDAIRNDPDAGASVVPIVSSTLIVSLYTNVPVASFTKNAAWSINFGDQFEVDGMFTNDVNFNTNSPRATFPFIDPNTLQPAGTVVLIWTAGHFYMSVTTSSDVLGALYNYTGATQPIIGTVDLTISAGRFTNVNTIYFTGKNVTGTDRATQLSLDTGNIKGRADFIPPTVVIQSPAPNFASLNSIITVSGVAADNLGVSAVMWRLAGPHDDPTRSAARFDDWSPVDTLPQSDTAFIPRAAWRTAVDMSSFGPGTNHFWVTSQDPTGSYSPIATRDFFYSLPSPLTLQSTDGGVARGGLGVADGAMLIIDRFYVVNAVATDRNSIFLNWTDGNGAVVCVTPQYRFMMQDSLTLQANFGPNPFPAIKGTYNGLFSPSNGVNEIDAGLFTVIVRSDGTYSGKVFLESGAHPFTGNFSFYANASEPNAADSRFEIRIRGSKPLFGLLHIASPQAGTLNRAITGRLGVYDDRIQMRVGAPLDVRFAPGSSGGVEPGLYNLQLPPWPTTGPLGYGYGSILVRSNGTVATTINVADQSPVVSCSSSLDEAGNLPIYVTPYGGKGIVIGWLTFTNEPTSDVRGNNICWIKRRTGATYYRDGFHHVFGVTGSKYNAPQAGTNILGWTSGTLNFADLAFTGTPTTIAFDPVLNRFSFPNGNADNVRLRFLPATGLFIGTLSSPALPLRGVVLPKAKIASGCFLDQNQTGDVLFTTP